RAWSMAVFQGRLFVGTLPSGKVLSLEAGRNATADTSLPDGWHHIAAVRDTDRLKLYVDGKAVATSATFAASEFNLSSQKPLKIGFGAQDYFYGQMADVRIYQGALSMEEIQTLARAEE
ncbi:MAG TPA: LamG domain-containing protein, partial [Planctomycetaceae bacterium]|nr:LamG domain-containing protein [Planctomycetaceae bacterium]